MRKFRKCVSCGGALKGADQSFTFTCTSCVQKLPKYTTQQRAEAIDSKVEEMRAESHNAVVAEMRDSDPMIPPFSTVTEWADRLQSAHARELAEQQAAHAAKLARVAQDALAIDSELHNALARADAAEARVDAAMGLLREVTEWIDGWSPNFVDDSEWQPVADRIDAFLAQQALAGGERKDG